MYSICIYNNVYVRYTVYIYYSIMFYSLMLYIYCIGRRQYAESWKKMQELRAQIQVI